MGVRRYDWSEVQKFYDLGHSYRDCRARFGFSSMAWQKAKVRGDIRPRGRGMPVDQLLAAPRDRMHVKRRLLALGLLENRCGKCGITEWLGAPLSMHLDHINGVRDDHRLENLRMLCPNCHSQTPTYAGRNVRRARLRDGGPVV
jgi:5-methylcytosine-specific restriction endonuclease McrA